MTAPAISLVIATYNRALLLLDLLNDVAAQDLPSSRFEVILVDDGSEQPVRELLAGARFSYPLRLIEQSNAGQAVARHAGILQAQAGVIVIVDDDMRLAPDFLRRHLEAHEAGNTLVLGQIRSAPNLNSLPLFERFHARQLDLFVAAVRRGEPVRGAALCTGNVSFRSEDYLRIGGFDHGLGRSEDRDLGIRLEAAGARIAFSERAHTTHLSDHKDWQGWLRRARLYGTCDSMIADKHADIEYVDPWRFLFIVNPVSRPLLLLAVASPRVGELLSKQAQLTSVALDKLGLSSIAIAGTTLVYGLQYFMGVRDHAGSLFASAAALREHLRKRSRAHAT